MVEKLSFNQKSSFSLLRRSALFQNLGDSKMETPITPQVTAKISFMGSKWRNSETEAIACNICYVQRQMDLEKWTPFTWEDYKSHCAHQVTDTEKGVLEALVNGGKPVWNTSARLEPGYLVKKDDHYEVTEKFLNVIHQLMD